MQRAQTLWGRVASPKVQKSGQSQLEQTTATKRSGQFGQWLLRWLSRTSEPRVWQISDRNGNISWRVYDPVSQKTLHLSSEVEVRIWLEQRYQLH